MKHDAAQADEGVFFLPSGGGVETKVTSVQRVGWASRPPARADGDEIRAAHVSKRLDTRTTLSWAVRSLTVAALIGKR